MTDARDQSAGMVRITVKLRPDQYDELFRHVREIGSTMSAFCRESMTKAMKEERPDVMHSQSEHQLMRRLECASPRRQLPVLKRKSPESQV